MSTRETSHCGATRPIGIALKFHLVGCVLLAALVAACGSTPVATRNVSPVPTSNASTGTAPSAQPPTGTTSGSPLPSPRANPSPSVNLFAVVETGANASQPGTVAIVGLDGYAKAKATFQPRVGPVVPDAYTPLQSVAQVVGSSVYYIDGVGTVRVLRVGSQPQVVARFPLQPAQEDIWFAVSPDGSRVVAGILTLPALGPNVPGTGWPTLVGPWKFDLKMATAGGQTTNLVHTESAYEPDDQNHLWKPMFPVGWTSSGPVVMEPAYVTSQNAWTGGALYSIDDTGKKIKQLGGTGCNSASITSTGLIPCSIVTSNNVTVRDLGGAVVWATHVDGSIAWDVRLSPGAQAILSDRQVETKAGGIVPMASNFGTQGWLDGQTVLGRVQYTTTQGNLSWVGLSDPTTIHDLGFQGTFVAAIG
jgi:hypothetical protein